jgi:hypothetical protein
MLITMRAFQGIGAGGLTALGTVLIADIISPRERGKYMGLMGAVMGVAMIGGPLLGGVLTDGPGWRWNFLIGLPFAVAAIIVLQRTLHLPALRRRSVTIDYAGALLISAGVTTLLLWVTFAGSKFDWASWQTAAMIVGALALVASIAVGVALFGTSVFLSQYMQVARGKTPTISGLLMIPMILGQLVSSTISGRIVSRTGRYRTLMISGAATLAIGLGLMGTIRYDTSFLLVGVYMVVLGIDVSALSGGTGAIPDVSTLPGPIRTVVEASYGQAVADLFLVAVPIALVALVAVLFLKEVPLGHRSGVELRLEVAQALADDDATRND